MGVDRLASSQRSVTFALSFVGRVGGAAGMIAHRVPAVPPSRHDHEGAVLRVRPKAMTVAVMLAGLITLMVGQIDAGDRVRQLSHDLAFLGTLATILCALLAMVVLVFLALGGAGRAD
jgi:hypothetical protein